MWMIRCHSIRINIDYFADHDLMLFHFLGGRPVPHPKPLSAGSWEGGTTQIMPVSLMPSVSATVNSAHPDGFRYNPPKKNSNKPLSQHLLWRSWTSTQIVGPWFGNLLFWSFLERSGLNCRFTARLNSPGFGLDTKEHSTNKTSLLSIILVAWRLKFTMVYLAIL